MLIYLVTIKFYYIIRTYKMGFPLITINRDYQTGGATVTQVENSLKFIHFAENNCSHLQTAIPVLNRTGFCCKRATTLQTRLFINGGSL